MASVDHWMPFFTGDYLKDTARLTTEQHGCYFLLIVDYWNAGAPPDDDEVLARITKLTLQQWLVQRPFIQGYFRICNGKWFHGRIDREKSDAIKRAEKNHKRAVSAANSRWKNKASKKKAVKKKVNFK